MVYARRAGPNLVVAPTCNKTRHRSIGFKELVSEHVAETFGVYKIRVLQGPDPRRKWSKHICTDMPEMLDMFASKEGRR